MFSSNQESQLSDYSISSVAYSKHITMIIIIIITIHIIDITKSKPITSSINH